MQSAIDPLIPNYGITGYVLFHPVGLIGTSLPSMHFQLISVETNSFTDSGINSSNSKTDPHANPADGMCN